jgi:hypothetical protein
MAETAGDWRLPDAGDPTGVTDAYHSPRTLCRCSINRETGSIISGEDRSPSREPDTLDDIEALVSSFIERNVADNEHPRAALVSRAGVARSDGDVRERLGSPAVVVITNARLLFVTPDENMNLQDWSVYYSDIAEVDIVRDAGNRVELRSTDAVQWRCTLPNADPEILDAVVRHLRWVNRVRRGVLALEERVETTSDEVRDHAANMDWDAAREAYQAVRTDLDALISMVQLTTPMADETLAPELTDIERTLEEAHVRLYIEQASSQLELGRYLVEHENYARAADVLERARDLHRQAQGQSDAVRRADDFAFGRQRELNEDLDRLEWELRAVAAEPIRQAQEAAVRARDTDDPEAATEYWETSVRRYDRILELDWWKEAQEAAEDVDDARAERDRAVRRLVETYTATADERWQEGVRSHERGDTAGALEQFESVVATLERAHELAVEAGHDDADSLGTQLSELRTTVEEFREGATGETDLPEVADDGPEMGEDPEESDDSGTETGPTGTGEAESSTPTVRIRQELFTTRTPNNDEWIPPSMSDIVAVEGGQGPDTDLEEIGLPDDVSTPDGDNGATDESGIDG